METPDLLPAPPYVHGPTWRRLRSGGYWLPAPNRTLGDQVINWGFQYIVHDSGPNAGEPFIPTDEQYRFILWWFAIDENGQFIYRNGVLRRLKGWGKDPLAAYLALADVGGPVVFSHWDKNGMPVGKPRHSPWVQIVGVAHEQTKNTFELFPKMISEKFKEDYGLEVNKTIIYTANGGRIESISSSAHTSEGNRPTFVIANEIQWWTDATGGHEMFKTLRGNVTKRASDNARWLAICNGHRPGENSIGEQLWDLYQSQLGGKAHDTKMLYDALEAPADTPIGEIPPEDVDPEGFAAGIEKLRKGLEIARGDAKWLDIDATITEIFDTSNLVSESRRMYLNQINAAEDSWMSPIYWDRCQKDIQLKPKDRITLAFDGSKSGDWAALVACRVEDAALFVIATWNPEHYNGEIPRDQVDAVVHSTFSKYEVVGFRADTRMWESYVDAWTSKYRRQLKISAIGHKTIAFDMRGSDASAARKQFAYDCERFYDAVMEQELSHDGNKVLRQHVLNAHRHPTPYETVSIRKAAKDSPRKIDAAVCAVMAFGLRQEFLMSKKYRTGKVAVFR